MWNQPPQLWGGNRAHLPPSDPLHDWFTGAPPPVPAIREEKPAITLRQVAHQSGADADPSRAVNG